MHLLKQHAAARGSTPCQRLVRRRRTFQTGWCKVLVYGCVCLSFLRAAPHGLAQTRDEKVLADREKVLTQAYWIYNDYPAALEEARKQNKPLVVALRCIPCEECVKLDEELIEADEHIRKLLDQFVRVRIISTNGLDLTQFQFDTDQSFAMFTLNADGTVYGRFGTRSDQVRWADDVSLEGLAVALRRSLRLHEAYTHGQAPELAAKKAASVPFPKPEAMPLFRDKFASSIQYKVGVAKSCIHCHMVGDGMKSWRRQGNKPFPQSELFPYPHPKAVGLVLDPKQAAAVLQVLPDSPAAASGFQAGDVLTHMDGVPLISIADVQWMLHNAPESDARIRVKVMRSGEPVEVTLSLPKDWKTNDDISWRASTWELRRMALGGLFLEAADKELRKQIGAVEGDMALRVRHAGEYEPHNNAFSQGIRAGDVVIAIDGKRNVLRETDAIAYAMSKPVEGGAVQLTVRQGEAIKEFSIPLAR